MYRRIFSHTIRGIPKIAKLSTFFLSMMFLKDHTQIMKPMNCLEFNPLSSKNIFNQVLPKIIRIQQNGQIVGYSYCFNEHSMITPSHELFDKKHNINQYQFFIGEKKINSTMKVIGRFEHLTFIESSEKILPVLPFKQTNLYTPIHIVQNRSYVSIRDGYYVGNQSGFGVINGKGQVGSLVLNEHGVVGIVTHIGRDQDYGFLRVVLWKDVKTVANKLKKQKDKGIYLGVSAIASDLSGVSIVRVSSTSPLINYIKMGDIITKINGHTVRNPQDLTRLIMLSEGNINIQVETAEKNKNTLNVSIQF